MSPLHYATCVTRENVFGLAKTETVTRDLFARQIPNFVTQFLRHGVQAIHGNSFSGKKASVNKGKSDSDNSVWVCQAVTEAYVVAGRYRRTH